MKTLAPILLDIQRSVGRIQKDSENPHFHNTYVSLEGLFDVVLPILHENDILLTQVPAVVEGQPALHTTLLHLPSTEMLESTMLLNVAPGNPQAQGSGLTYARRYSVITILGLLTEDDDGEAARPREATQRRSSGSRASTEAPTPAW